MRKNILLFITCGFVGVIMYDIKEHTSVTMATIILAACVAVLWTLDGLWKRYKRKQEQE
ncbi:hypothetical protein [Bacillus changyiensis]|uniref:hypothetical protein n=1 Tax=Bacillus changyiensis TaxID=3004103 RepID=UPI0022E1B5DD|nr:hypothetical protein [Bacillus changyiensis]MDA1478377.1 hypothetical protein [Bacillus changyiensis]